MSIVVIGTVYVDIKGYPIGNFVPAGRNVGTVKQFHGGVARNIAEDVAGLGEDAFFVSLTDKSGIGADVINHLKAKNVRTDYVRTTDDGMGTWLAVFDTKGEVCANLSVRPNLLPIYDILVDNGDEIFSLADSILLEIDIDERIVAETFRLAEKHSVPVYAVISNMTIAKERLPYIQQSQCFVCNREEAGILFDQSTTDISASEMLELVKQKKAELQIPTMIVTMDEKGAVYVGEDGTAGTLPAQKVNVVDTTGAGDAFFAGVSVGLTQGKSLPEACELGIRTASVVIATEDNVYNP